MIDRTWTTLLGNCSVCFTGLLFLVAGSHKLFAQSRFSGFLADYRLVPARWTGVVSWVIIGAEFAVPLALVSTQTRDAGGVLAISLLLGYALGMAINLYRGRRQIECGCGGPPQPLSGSLLVRNGCLAAVTLLIFMPRTGLTSVASAAMGFAAGLVLWSVYAFISQVLSNQSQLNQLVGEHS